MRVENTIQAIFDSYPILYSNREDVLVYLLCFFGTGYEWSNGQLIQTCDKKIKKYNKLIKGKAHQYYDNRVDKILYLMYSSRKRKVSFGSFISTLKATNIYDSINEGLDEKMFLPNSLSNIINYSDLPKLMCKEYSPLFNIPEDITDDWRAAVNEVKEILKSHNVDLKR